MARVAASAVAGVAAWTRVQKYVEKIETGSLPEDLAREPLWLSPCPREFLIAWDELKQTLLPLHGNWRVWTDWYEDRLAGAEAERALISELELKRILIPEDVWEQGPYTVNAVIADLEDEYRRPPPPDTAIPEQQPAIIGVELGDDGRLHRSAAHPTEAANRDRESDLREAWEAHQDQLAALEHLDPGRNWPALKTALAAYRGAMGAGYDDLKVVGLGMHGLRVTGLANAADEILMADLAEEVKSLSVGYGLFIRQFGAWRRYLEEASDDAPAAAVEAAAGLLRAAANHLEIIAPDISEAAIEIAEAIEPEYQLAKPGATPDSSTAMRRETVRSIGNILSGMVAAIGGFIGDASASMRKGAIKEFETAGKYAVRAMAFLTLGGVMSLTVLLPAHFGWLTHAVNAIKAAFGL